MPRHIQLLPGEQITLADGTVVSAEPRYSALPQAPMGSAAEPPVVDPIAQAIKCAGGPSKVARQCGVSVQAVCFWRDGERTLPAGHCITLEKMNGGRIRCEEMLPGIDWGYLRASGPLLPDQAAEDAPSA